MQIPIPAPILTPNNPDLSTPAEQAVEIPCAAGKFRIARYQLTDGPSQGVELLVIESGRARAAICPTRGMGLWKAEIDSIPCGWNSPVRGPVHPSFVALSEGNGLGWLDGFDELLVRCGMQSFGAPDLDANGNVLYGLHGRVGNLPATNLRLSLDADHSLLEVTADVFETRFLQYNLQLTASYRFAFDQPVIEVNDRVTNHSSSVAGVQMLYHVNMGDPLLEAGAKLHTACDRIVARNEHAATDLATWNTYNAPTPGYEEQVYFSASRPDPSGWASAMLASPAGDRGFALHYDVSTLPFFTQWKNTVAKPTGYVTGLEPGTGFPNPRSFEQEKGRVVELASGKSLEFRLKLEGLSDAASVSRLQQRLTEQAGGLPKTVEFDADWCTPRL